MNVGTFLKAARAARGLTWDEIAEAVGRSRGTLRHVVIRTRGRSGKFSPDDVTALMGLLSLCEMCQERLRRLVLDEWLGPWGPMPEVEGCECGVCSEGVTDD